MPTTPVATVYATKVAGEETPRRPRRSMPSMRPHPDRCAIDVTWAPKGPRHRRSSPIAYQRTPVRYIVSPHKRSRSPETPTADKKNAASMSPAQPSAKRPRIDASELEESASSSRESTTDSK